MNFVENLKTWKLILIFFWSFYVCLLFWYPEWNCVLKRLKFNKKCLPTKSKRLSNCEATNHIFLIVFHILNQSAHLYTMVRSSMENRYSFTEIIKNHRKKLKKYFLSTSKPKLHIALSPLFSENRLSILTDLCLSFKFRTCT